jgi:phosphatidate cytidylyltransferase
MALVRLRVDVPRGAQWLLFALCLVWAADVGAYFAGRSFGHTKLAPQVSPGKTWEGVLGGLVFAGLVALWGSWWFALPALKLVPVCLVVVAFSVVGDLTESLLKRFAGLKDSGTLFPGHGGVMDRIDSLTSAMPVLLLGLQVLEVAR